MPDLTKKQTAALLAIDAGARAGTPLRQSNSTTETTVYWQQCQGLERAGLLEPINGFGDLTLSIVAAGLKLAELLERAPDSHCPACGRTRSTCTCWGPHGVMVDG